MAVAPVIVENGTIVAGANSYASVAGLRQYADNHGVTTVPPDDGAAAVTLYKALAYIETLEPRFRGVRATFALNVLTGQPLSWPRAYVNVNGVLLDSTIIPVQLIMAQLQLACDVSAGYELMPTVATTGNLKKSVVGPVTKEYFDPRFVSASPTPSFIAANAMLFPLLQYGVGNVRNVRV